MMKRAMARAQRGLTDLQRQVLKKIVELTKKSGGTPPTFAEIGEAMGTDKVSVRQHCMALQRKGYVSWKPESIRTLHVLKTEART